VAAGDEMTIDERRKYLMKMHGRYRVADRAGRGVLLTEMEAVTGLHRKSLTRLLAAPSLARRPRQRQRGRVYGAELRTVVAVVWESLDYICAERLTPALLPTARHLAAFGECRLTPAVEAQLGTISRATVQRLLTPLPRPTPRLPRGGPEQANRLRREVPMKRLPWQTSAPGHFEVDLVHHCGASTAGEYVHTLQMVDVATGWSERAAVLGRSQRAMEAGFRRILGRLPFPVRELHPDNGGEFFNDHLLRFWGEEITGLTLSRSRPYHKNDNRLVEQKNDTLVRAYVGYGRLDTPAQVAALDQLYEQLWVFYNLFQPVLHLAEKVLTTDKVRRKWDTAATPYQRLGATDALSHEWRTTLDALHARTNPRHLRRAIYQDLARLWQPASLAALAAD
jgi:hypothetical protein